uniref:ABC transporter domain-containing protein n=1 Tax=Ananas comosus var. bracteatus TaxID=296719 RepID=A0A6V7NQK7_ANACO|nr:unnamed protein product [Ananas comosus var. bracteatus]
MPPHEPDQSGGGHRNEPMAVHPSPSTAPFDAREGGAAERRLVVAEQGNGNGNGNGGEREDDPKRDNGYVCPGEMLAMLGPSGSGKTTLLTGLGGRLPGKLHSGKITYNGHPFCGSVKRRTGFVAQDDVLYPHLTVAETLRYTALLRLPRKLGAAEKAARAEGVMLELGLGRVAHSMVGGVRGVRGLLLLDEPTSGLDSTTAARIVGALRRMAADGRRTVVVTIHQPSSRLYHMFDKVLLLSAEGCPIYYGRAADALPYFASVGFASRLSVNPADLMLDLANGISPDSKESNEINNGDSNLANESAETVARDPKAVKEELISAYDRNIATRLKAELCGVDPANFGYARDTSVRVKREKWSIGWWEQFSVLLSRGLKERRYESFNKLRILQVLSVAILGGLLWWKTPPSHIQDRTALIFFFSVFWGFFPLYNAVFTFPQERPMLAKERASGMYRLSSYFLARTVGDLPMELGLPTAFVVIIYWMGGLRPDPAAFVLSLLVVLFSVLVAQSLGLAFGALLMDVKQATTLASVTTLVFLIAGGYYFRETDRYECGGAATCPVVDFPAIKSVGLTHMWVDVCIMGLMLVGYRLLAYSALHRLQPPTR